MLQENPKSKRPLDRPKLHFWEDCIRKDFINAMGINNGNRNWKEVAENKEE